MAPVLQRSLTAQKPTVTQFKGERTTRWEQPPGSLSVLEIQRIENPAAFKDVPAAENYLIPPYHWHWYQREFFEIKSGRYIFKLEGVETLCTPSSGTITIPPQKAHTFWADPTSSEPCEVHISATPTNGLDERFFRNIYSYLEDTAVQGIAPSLPQLLLFLDYAETSLAIPGPGWIMRPVSWALGVVVGRWFGGYVLGLKASYEEYYEEKKGI